MKSDLSMSFLDVLDSLPKENGEMNTLVDDIRQLLYPESVETISVTTSAAPIPTTVYDSAVTVSVAAVSPSLSQKPPQAVSVAEVSSSLSQKPPQAVSVAEVSSSLSQKPTHDVWVTRPAPVKNESSCCIIM
jgi:hypothetical protein